MKTTFVTFVREKRLDKNIGLSNFAKMVGMSPPGYSKIEAHRIKPSIEFVKLVGESLNIEVDILNNLLLDWHEAKPFEFNPKTMLVERIKKSETFGSIVRKARLQKKIGLREFAIMMDLSPAYISQMENGVCKPPIESKIIKIAEKLDINIDYLLALAGRISNEIKNKMIDKIIEENKPIKVFTEEQKIAFYKLKRRIADIECSYFGQCPFNFFESDKDGNRALFQALTIENIDKNYVFERLMSAKEHIMVYDSEIKNEDDTFEKIGFRIDINGDFTPESYFYKKKDVVNICLQNIEEAELCLMAI